MERILLLMAATGAAEAEAALQSALDNALAPKRLSFGLSLLREPDEIEAAALRRLGACQLMAPAADPWLDFAELWQGEGFLLIGSPDMRFVRHWDMLLLRELRACQPPWTQSSLSETRPPSGGTTYAEVPKSNASRSSGGSAREGLLSEKPPPSHTSHVPYSQPLFGRGGLGERRFSQRSGLSPRISLHHRPHYVLSTPCVVEGANAAHLVDA